MMKKLFVLALILSQCLSLTACGDSGNGGNGGSSNDPGVTPTRIEGMLKEEYDNTDYTSYLGTWDGVVNEGEDEQKLVAELTYCGFSRFVRSTKIMSMPATNMTVAAICAGLIPMTRCTLNSTLTEILVSLFLKVRFPAGQPIRKPVMVSFQTLPVSGIWTAM